jgi:hypothetical protein
MFLTSRLRRKEWRQTKNNLDGVGYLQVKKSEIACIMTLDFVFNVHKTETNVLRRAVIRKYNINKDFELSQRFLFFYGILLQNLYCYDQLEAIYR